MANLVPIVVEDSGRGERSFDLFSRLMRDRVIFINGAIDDHMSEIVCAQLLFLESEKPTADINLYINSPGGSVLSGLSIFDTIRFVSCPVSTVVMGQAASMGSFLAAGGEKGKRFSLPNARFMYHQVSSGFKGQATDIEIHARETVRLKEILTQHYSDFSGRTYDELWQMMERDRFMSPSEAKEWGFVDEIIEKRKV